MQYLIWRILNIADITDYRINFHRVCHPGPAVVDVIRHIICKVLYIAYRFHNSVVISNRIMRKTYKSDKSTSILTSSRMFNFIL